MCAAMICKCSATPEDRQEPKVPIAVCKIGLAQGHNIFIAIRTRLFQALPKLTSLLLGVFFILLFLFIYLFIFILSFLHTFYPVMWQTGFIFLNPCTITYVAAARATFCTCSRIFPYCCYIYFA